jgi:hypothetical protein
MRPSLRLRRSSVSTLGSEDGCCAITHTLQLLGIEFIGKTHSINFVIYCQSDGLYLSAIR